MQHFPLLPTTVKLSLNCLLNKFSVIGHWGTLGDLWHIVELRHLNPISLLVFCWFFFFPSPSLFCLVELSGNCWSQNNSISREGCFGVSTCIIICYNYHSLHPMGTVSRKGPVFCSACYRLCWRSSFWHPLWSSILKARAALGCSARTWVIRLCFLAELLPRTICFRDWFCQCSLFRKGILTLQLLWPGLGLSRCLHVCPSAPSYVLQMQWSVFKGSNAGKRVEVSKTLSSWALVKIDEKSVKWWARGGGKSFYFCTLEK